jgi:hypothetical protein
MSDAPISPSPWPRRFGFCGMAAAGLAALGAYGSGWGLWPFTIGFLLIAVALLLALVALIGGLIMLARRRGGAALLLGMAAALGLIGIMGNSIYRGSQVPAIHDVTTNVDNPPTFEHLTLRADNLVGLEGGVEEWRRLHREAYGDIRPVIINRPAAPTMMIIAETIRARGWELAHAETARIEATETVSPFRFKDDIVIIATPQAEGANTRIDIRSVSRVGVSDMGVNARRIRALIADIQAAQED